MAVDDGLEKFIVFKCEGGTIVDSRGGGGWLDAWAGRLSTESSIESTGELPRDDKAKSSLNTSGFDSLDIEGRSDKDWRDTEDSREGDRRVAILVFNAASRRQGVVGT